MSRENELDFSGGVQERSAQERDILCEIGNIAGGNALTSLSMMLGQPLKLEVPECRAVRRDLAGQMLANPQALYAGVAMTMTGTFECMLALLLNRDFTKVVLDTIDDEEVGDVRALTEMQKSAICEVGNIMGNSYVTALATLLGRQINVSVPNMVVDTGENVLRYFLKQYSVRSESFLFINNSFSLPDRRLDSYMLLCPTAETLDEIIRKLNG